MTRNQTTGRAQAAAGRIALLASCSVVAALLAGPVSTAEIRQGGKGSVLTMFDGHVVSERFARRIANSMGDTYVAHEICADGDGNPLSGCLDVTVDKANGKRFEYRLVEQTCSSMTFSNGKGKSMTLSDSLTQAGDVLNARSRCYGDYRVMFRIRHELTQDVRSGSTSIFSTSQLQFPGSPGQALWVNGASVDFSSTVSRLASVPRVDWMLEQKDSSGAVVYSDGGSDVSLPARSTAPRQPRRFGTGAFSPEELCAVRADTVESGMAFVASGAGLTCTAGSLGVGAISLGTEPPADEGGPFLTVSIGSICGKLESHYLNLGAFAGQAYYDSCINDIPDEPDEPAPPGTAPNPPNEVPDPGKVVQPICPEASSVPHTTNYTYQDGDTVMYCSVMAQTICTIDEEMNSCNCNDVAVGQSHCVGIVESSDWEVVQ